MSGSKADMQMPFTRQQLEAVEQQSPEQAQPILQQWALAMYGSTMLQVQAFEQMLAALDLVVTARPSNQTTEKGLRRRIEQRFTRIQHLLERATASEIKRELDGLIDADLLSEIAFLIGWRNRLAHSYLRQRLIPDPPTEGKTTTASVDTVYELLEIGQAFAAANRRIADAQDQIRNQWELSGGAPVSAELMEWALTTLVEILSAKAPKFRPREASSASTESATS